MSEALALIDAELFLYRAAAAAQYEEEWAPDEWTYVCRHGEARATFQDHLAMVRDELPDHQICLCFGDRVSFRYSLWPSYKANRKTNRKPAGYGALVEWAKDAASGRGWQVETFPEVEGDDVLGLLYGPGDVIVSDDKDMLTLPGRHLRAGLLVDVSPVEADQAFFTQVLTGDSSDNYPGCQGVGPVGAAKLLKGVTDPAEMWARVLAAFHKAGHSTQFAITQARCARILRAGEYAGNGPILWTPPGGET